MVIRKLFVPLWQKQGTTTKQQKNMVIKFIPPKHLRIFNSDRGFVTDCRGAYRCSYLDICHFSREKRFARLDDAVAFMEGLGYVNAN